MALPPHHQTFVSNIDEVRRLLEIHEELTGTGPGKRHNVQVLNKSAITLLVACWESFVEDACEAALDAMLSKASKPAAFPEPVLGAVASKLQGRKAWSLAGSGWRQVLRDNKKEILARTTQKLNTPGSAKIRDLFSKTIGLKDLPRSWHWQGKSAAVAAADLDALVRLRGAIAHRVQASAPVHKKRVREEIRLVRCLAVRTSNRVRDYVHERTRKYPWGRVKLGNIR